MGKLASTVGVVFHASPEVGDATDKLTVSPWQTLAPADQPRTPAVLRFFGDLQESIAHLLF